MHDSFHAFMLSFRLLCQAAFKKDCTHCTCRTRVDMRSCLTAFMHDSMNDCLQVASYEWLSGQKLDSMNAGRLAFMHSG